MSQAGSFISTTGGGNVNLLTGNTGGVIGPDGLANINVVGANIITITGNPGTNTLTATVINGANGQVIIGGGVNPLWATMTSTGGTIVFTPGANTLNLEASTAGASSFPTDTGTATAAGNVLTVTGGANIDTSGAGSVVTVALPTTITNMFQIDFQQDGALRTNTAAGQRLNLQAYDTDGLAYMSFAQLVSGTTPTMDLADTVTKDGQYIYRVGGNDVAITDGGTGLSTTPVNGQLLIGNAGNYSLANLTSTGGSVIITNGAGSINLEAGAATATTFNADGGSATPALNAITMAGGTNITTSGAAATITMNLDSVLAGISSTTFNTAGAIQTGTGATNNLFLRAYDVDGTSYTTFATLTANNTPTMDLADSVTKANQYIYRASGTDVAIIDGGTGLSTTPNNGQLLIGNSSNYSVANLTSSGASVTITNGAGTINLESINQNGANTFNGDTGSATPSTNIITIAGGTNLTTVGSVFTLTVNMDSSLTALDNITMNNNGSLRTGIAVNDMVFLQARDVDGASYTTFATLTANNTPTFDLSDAVTKSGQYIYRAFGIDVPVADGGTGVSTLTAYGVICGGTTTTSPVQSVTDIGEASQVLTSNGAGALPTFQNAAGFPWNEVTNGTITLAGNNGYILNNAAQLKATLPATAAVGAIISIVGKGAGGWIVEQLAGQKMNFGTSSTTTGVAGSLASTNINDCMEIICIIANTEYTVRSSVGNLTVS
jgi:hypothetical protein